MTQSESPFYFQFPDSLWPEESLAKNYFTPAYILIVTVYRGDISGEPVHYLCGGFCFFLGFFLGGVYKGCILTHFLFVAAVSSF